MKLFAIAASSAYVAQATSLWSPTGPYEVGYMQHIFDHVTLNDFTKPGTFMLVTIYYPTLQKAKMSVPYMDNITAPFYEATVGLNNGSLSKLTTRLQCNAPTLLGTDPAFGNSTSPYPTLFFTPGAGPGSSVYTAYLSELASTGYAVVAIDHPGEPPYLPLPNEYNGSKGVYGYPNFHAFPPSNEAAVINLDYRVSDILAAASDSFVPAFVRQHGLPFNLTHLGVFGHSLGGSAAAAVMAANTSEAQLFKLGSNIDGTFIQLLDPGTGTILDNATDLGRPFLELASEPHMQYNKTSPFNDGTWENFNRPQTAWLRDLGMNGTRHMDFSDVPLWFDLTGQGEAARNKTPPEIGPISGAKAVQLACQLLKDFFGNLRGESLAAVDETIKKESKYLYLVYGQK